MRRHAARQAERSRHHRPRREPHQAPLQHPQETAAPAHQRRPGLRPVRHARHHALRAGLLRRARHHPQPLAPRARPHQGFHRHAAAEFLPVAAHLGDHRRRHALRNPDPHRRDAQDGGGRHRRPLEIQRRPGLGAGRAAPRLAAAGGRVAARRFRSQRISLHAENRSLSRRGLHLHAQRQGRGSAARIHAHRFRLLRFTPKSATVASARRSTAAWCRCATSCTPATSSRSSPSPATSPAATGSASSSPRARATRSSTGSTSTSASAPSKSAAS